MAETGAKRVNSQSNSHSRICDGIYFEMLFVVEFTLRNYS